MDELKKCLKFLKQTVSDEVSCLELFKGEKFDKFVDNFNLEETIRIYYNEYNLVFINENDYLQIAPYLKRDDIVMELKLPKSNIYMCVYQYFNSKLLEDYIN